MKNKEWYYKTKLGGKDTFQLTEKGKSIPEVLKSYLEYYNIKQEDLFQYASDYNLDTEFQLWAKERISTKLKNKGATESEIQEAVDLFLNIDDMIKKEDDE
ncbi:MAG: hypothetical protein K2N74_05690 [Clostridiales bacterium]|nr:hypothetical protein [Clostridiales bacterium]